MYDVVIIGAGMSGMTAAIYTTRRELKTLVIASELGGQMAKNAEIENWPGEEHLNGAQLAQKIQKQAQKFGAEFKFEFVKKITAQKDCFDIKTAFNRYRTKTVILAFGKTPRKIGVVGEDKLIGKGVSYCVTCDGPFFRGKDVAVVGGGNSALDAALLLSKISPKVYLIHRREQFTAEALAVDKVKQALNITMILGANVLEIIGEDKVEKIKLDTGKVTNVLGLFIEIGSEVDDSLTKNLVKIDENKQVIVDQNQMTSVPGIFAAGDLTNTPYKQLVIAAGEGAKAALSAYHFIEGKL